MTRVCGAPRAEAQEASRGRWGRPSSRRGGQRLRLMQCKASISFPVSASIGATGGEVLAVFRLA